MTMNLFLCRLGVPLLYLLCIWAGFQYQGYRERVRKTERDTDKLIREMEHGKEWEDLQADSLVKLRLAIQDFDDRPYQAKIEIALKALNEFGGTPEERQEMHDDIRRWSQVVNRI